MTIMQRLGLSSFPLFKSFLSSPLSDFPHGSFGSETWCSSGVLRLFGSSNERSEAPVTVEPDRQHSVVAFERHANSIFLFI